MVCTGHHVHPHIPHIYGIEDFRGPKIHSHEYKRPGPFQDKRVLIIGTLFFFTNYIVYFLVLYKVQNIVVDSKFRFRNLDAISSRPFSDLL